MESIRKESIRGENGIDEKGSKKMDQTHKTRWILFVSFLGVSLFTS